MGAQTSDDDIGLVLLHGAELGSWLWERVQPLLQRPAVAVDLPGRGSRPSDPRSVRLDDAVRAVVEDSARLRAERVVVVAHSFSGILVPPVLDRLGDRAAAAVFLAAAVPQEGKSWVDLLPAPQRIPLRVMYRLRPGGVLSPAGQNRTTLCNDLDDATTTTVIERRVPEPPRLLLDAVSPAAIPRGLPRHYVRSSEDRTTSAVAEARAIRRLHEPRLHELPAGHLPMLSRPTDLADLLERIADDVRSQP